MGHGDPELHRLATKKELDRRRDSRQVTYLNDPSICGDQEAAFEKHRDGDQNSDRCERSPKFKVNAFRAPFVSQARLDDLATCRSLGIALESSNAHATEPNWAGNNNLPMEMLPAYL